MLDRVETSIANMPKKEAKALMRKLDKTLSKFEYPEAKF